jgi:hypothetical protein
MPSTCLASDAQPREHNTTARLGDCGIAAALI